jgi:enoyl-CoA hydratase
MAMVVERVEFGVEWGRNPEERERRMGYENITLSVENEIGILTVNRPKVLNALNVETLKDIQAGIQEVKGQAGIRVLIVTGAGEKAFVAGADIQGMSSMNSVEALDFSRLGHFTLKMIQDLDRPVIAAVNGYALGGGTEIALACDFIYASENARFGLPEVTLGIFPGFGGTQRLPRLIGKGKAKELIYTGKLITAQEAFEMGIVNRVFPQASLMEETKKVAAQIAGNGRLASDSPRWLSIAVSIWISEKPAVWSPMPSASASRPRIRRKE